MYLVFNDLGKLPHNASIKDMNRFRSYNVLGYRAPKAGEWYLSGAKVGAYYAKCDFNQDNKFLVVEPSKQMYVARNVVNWFPI